MLYECTVLRAVPIAFVNLGSLYCLVRGLRGRSLRWVFFAGLLAGLSMCLRPNLLFLTFLLFPFVRSWDRALRIKGAGLFFLAVILAVAPLTARNFAAGHKVIISTSNYKTFWIGNNYQSPGFGYDYSDAFISRSKETEGDQSIKNIVQVWARDVTRYPAQNAGIWWRKVKMVFNGYEVPANLSFDLFRRNSLFLKLAPFDFRFISPLAIFGLFLAFRRERTEPLYIYLVLCVAMLLVFHIQGRFRIVCVPFFILFAARTLAWTWSLVQRKKKRALALTCAGLVFLVLFTKPDDSFLKKYGGGRIRYADYFNFAIAHLKEYELIKNSLSNKEEHAYLQMAYQDLLNALEFSEGMWRADVLIVLGEVQIKMGEFRKARESFRNAIILNPDNGKARQHFNRLDDFLQLKDRSLQAEHDLIR